MTTLAKIAINQVVKAAQKAGEIILEYYKGDIEIVRKADNSPVTVADKHSSEYIIGVLEKLHPEIPVISEENDDKQNLAILHKHKLFWLIDPLDGTWVFINKKGTFTVNIALVEDGVPIFGVVYSPLDKATYYNDETAAYKIHNKITKKIHPKVPGIEGYDFLVSNVNVNQSTADFIAKYKVNTITPIPSSIKLVLLAEGSGDIYPRFKPTYSWDTAAGHAVLRAVGGEVYDTSGKPLVYNRKTLLNPSFIAVSNTSFFS
ncbi:MAG: 3'(2'),5'-bisphosphate nucleotidase CysQ [Rickettsiales bacterium]